MRSTPEACRHEFDTRFYSLEQAAFRRHELDTRVYSFEESNQYAHATASGRVGILHELNDTGGTVFGPIHGQRDWCTEED